jgi:hypothetical protein
MSPNLDCAMEKRSPEYFDNPGFVSGSDLDNPKNEKMTGSENSDSYSYPVACVQPKMHIRKSTQILSALAGMFVF